MTVLVAMPFYGPQDLLQRGVRSVLAQTHDDLQLLVIGDGQAPEIGAIADRRLVTYTLPENRGPYFAQAVALAANPHQWYAPVGADDWVDPVHLAVLMAAGGSAVVPGVLWFHRGRRVAAHEGLYEVGLFETERLRSIGGYNPAERIGQDTLTMRLLRLTGDVRAANIATYHRVRRAGSLTTSPETGHGSTARNAMRARNRAVFAKATELRHAVAIREYRNSLIPREIADAVLHHAAVLQPRLEGAA